MNYYFNNTLNNISFDDAKEKVIEELKKEGFGVLSQIDMKSTLKNKLDVDFRPYVILGACNPPLAYKTLQAEAKIGLMLPCNVIVEENENGTIEVSAVNPVASMIAVKNDNLADIASEVEQILKKVIENL
jgi:uncharacterized protein (DUF302 family)